MKKLKILLQSNYFYFFLFVLISCFVFVKTKVINYSSSISEDTRVITATITSFKIDGNKISFYLKEKETFVATYYISTKDEKNFLQNNLKIGMTLYLEGEKQEILNNTIPNTFNYKKYLYNKQIYFSFLISKITILDSKLSLINKVKNYVSERIDGLNNNAYLKAFVLGDKSLMLNDVQEKIQDNGVSHLFALSGMHLSFIYAFLDKVLKKLKKRKILIYIFLLFYLGLANFPVSFIRAILFTFLLDLNKFFSWNISKIKILGLVAALLILYNPFYIYDIGFIYTFIVTFSLLFCSNLLSEKNKFIQTIIVSCITFLFSAPITVYMNYEINILSIFNNIILVPLVSFIIFPLAIFTFFMPFLLPLFSFLTQMMEQLNLFLNTFSFYLIVGKITILDVVLYYFFLILFIKSNSKLMLFILLLHIFFLYHKDIFVTHSSIYFLDVGQGDSTLFVTPRNKEVILIDTGGKIVYEKEDWEVKDKEYDLIDTILQFLKSKRIRSIDTLILTHGDYDHMGEAIDLVNNFKVEKVIFNKGKYNDLELELIKILEEKNIKHYQNIKELNIDNNKLYFLNNEIYDNENDNSNVIYTEINGLKLLLMGDAGIDVEGNIIKKYNIKDIDILKVGHHGSKTSSGEYFIDKINPKYSIISVGKNNRYGHPNYNVLDNLEDSKIYRTDQNGSIMFKIKNNKLEIETCTPNDELL